ncbi:cyclopropane fatty acid synthase domain-containing protein [Russula brevipes]|nr:cyclopropane fatty acid synthase domain-containing protein [Russula brevipes]
MSGSPRLTNVPNFKNAPLVGLAEGNGSFSNYVLASLVLGVPWLLKRVLPFVNRGGSKTYLFLTALLGLPVTVAYWTLMSMFGPRKNEKVVLPGKDIEEYITIKDPELKVRYHGKEKIPMQTFHDAYFDGKIDFNGDVLDTLEARHDWTKMVFTPDLFKYVLTQMIPEVIVHSESQDEEQVRGHYDRTHHHLILFSPHSSFESLSSRFLGPRMVYTSGIMTSIAEPQTLEQLQDNKLTVVCEKLNLQPTDHLLDIGCGWGTLAAFAHKNYGCEVTGITLGKNQTKFGNERIRTNGGDSERARILCLDYRAIPGGPGHYTKIVSLEMAEHVGVRRYSTFLRQVYDLLDDDGVFVFQVAGLRPSWQYEDLIWGLFMNKYVFPGADASASLGWLWIEVKNIDVLGVHYSATIFHWYNNWLSNREKVVAKYGERWFRIWAFFLAVSRDRRGTIRVC